MRILAAIANFGGRNQQYLDRLLAEYRAMPFDVHIAILSNIPLDKGAGVEVIVGMPAENPLSLPFAHKQLFADRQDDFDLFVFSEDDTLIAARNIQAFLEATPLLDSDRIAGFLRTERAPDGTTRVSTVHHRFFWEPTSVCTLGGETFAHFTNLHSGSFVLTRSQLRKVIASGGFLVPPHEGEYEMLETAATDPYTQCGLKKMICISRIDDFLLPHLPNRYIGIMGLARSHLDRQIEALRAVARGELPAGRLCNTSTRVRHCAWSKDHYEEPRPEMIAMVPPAAGSVLSLGCGWGAAEEALMRRGLAVTAVPVDAVVGSCAAARGVEIVYGAFDETLQKLESRRFGCLFISNLLHLVPDPAGLLRSFGRLMKDGGLVVAGIPNFNRAYLRFKRLLRDPLIPSPAGFSESGVHAAAASALKRWLRDAGLRIERTAYRVPDRHRKPAAWLLHAADPLCGSEVIVSARRR